MRAQEGGRRASNATFEANLRLQIEKGTIGDVQQVGEEQRDV